MCLAEALLRIPDRATRDALIRDKVSRGDWKSHMGGSQSLFVNAATWGLMITGKLVAVNSEQSLSKALTRLIGKGGEPLVRKGVNMAMRMMGEQFVSGQTISEALANNRKMEARGFRYSYDMLGEAATTAEDADRYYASYEQAIHAIGKAAAGRGIYEGGHFHQAVGAASALFARPARARHGRAAAAREGADRAGAQLRHRPEHRRRGSRPPGDLAGPAGGAVLRARAGRLERHRLRDPGLPEARALRDRLRDRPGAPQPPPRDGAAGQGRLLGQRDQARPGRWPGRLPGLYPQDLHRRGLPGLRPQAAGRARGRVSAVRHAQRLHAVGHLSAGRPELLPRSVRVPVPARHGRAAVRRSGRPIGAGQAEPPVPHLCAGGHARDAAGLSGAPPAGEWRQHLVREPDRRREHSGRAAGVRSGGRRLARRAAGRAARRSRCRANSSATRRKARAPTPPAWT